MKVLVYSEIVLVVLLFLAGLVGWMTDGFDGPKATFFFSVYRVFLL
jgi:hypothetical protein